MTVDFGFKRVSSMRVASVTWKGNADEKRIRREFEGLDRWIRDHRLHSGRWVFLEPGERRWTVAIEVKGKGRGDSKVRLRTFPASRVAWVTFNPDQVSARVIYHGLNDWLRWRRKDGTVKRVVASREVYDANPWKNSSAWERTEVQFTVRP